MDIVLAVIIKQRLKTAPLRAIPTFSLTLNSDDVRASAILAFYRRPELGDEASSRLEGGFSASMVLDPVC
jgi:hypothetical protein